MLATNGSHNASSQSLASILAIALPEDVRIRVHHVSSNPTPCAAIFAAPPGSKPEKTFCESHFVTVSVAPSEAEAELFIYAIEILIYSTEHLTTLFVSKADSTGYSRLVETPRRSPSLLKTISSTLISHLVETRQRPGIKLVVSLFARAQDQYLFPGSIENRSKHVLDDRGLVRWWSGVLDTVLRQHVVAKEEQGAREGNAAPGDATRVKGYLIVPGCDKYETLSFLPTSAKTDPPDRKIWIDSHPLPQLATNANVPPRCLIPHFPDDPKARFLDELDDELPDSQASQNSPSKRHNNGQWKSVKTLEQFWELMAFRQECSSGRLVGFLWVVYTPPEKLSQPHSGTNGGRPVSTPVGNDPEPNMLLTPSHSQPQLQAPILRSLHPSPHSPPTNTLPPSLSPSPPPPPRNRPSRKRPLTGPIQPRPPRTKPLPTTATTTSPRLSSRAEAGQPAQPTTTKHHHRPPSHRSPLVLSAKNYQRAIDLLLRLDFADRRVAQNSTRRWVDEVGIIAGGGTGARAGAGGWGEVVVGIREATEGEGDGEGARTLDGGVVRGKRKSADGDGQARGVAEEEEGGKVRSAGSVGGGLRMAEAQAVSANVNVHVLSEGLVRKKKKEELQP